MGMTEQSTSQPTASPAFSIGPVPVHGRLILSPMAGYTDIPFRTICREMGSAMSYTPCIMDEGVIHNVDRTRPLFAFAERERPVAMQLLGKDDEQLAQAGAELAELGPDLIDLNLGCPARRVSGRGRGSGLLREPQTIARIARRLVDSLPVPITAKIRLGWDDHTRNYLQVARILEDCGVAAIAVHGRTREQGYSGRADWGAIAEVKRAAGVPVLANGDVRTVADIDAIAQVTGCDGVLIGRGAIGNPWLFQRRDIHEVGYEERLRVVRRHLLGMVELYGEPTGVARFRKHVVRYIQRYVGATDRRSALMAAETVRELLRLLGSWEPVLAANAPRGDGSESA